MVGHNVLVHCDCCVICCGLYYGSLSGSRNTAQREICKTPPGSYFILQGLTGRRRIGRKAGGGGGGTSSRCLFLQGMHVLGLWLTSQRQE